MKINRIYFRKLVESILLIEKLFHMFIDAIR
jgi:hypothetical protein